MTRRRSQNALRIDQLCAGFAPGDAISSEAMNMRRLLRGWGYLSDVYAWAPHIHADSRGECRSVEAFDPHRTQVIIYHFSIGSPITEAVVRFPGTKVMVYHNITPGRYFEAYAPVIARQLEEGRLQLAQLKDVFDLTLADSEFNRRELAELGFENTAVLPIVFDPGELPPVARRRRPRLLRRNLATVLFVGRLAPNKKADELVKLFDLYQRFWNPRSQLVWVGSWGGVELYYLELLRMIEELGVRDVVLPGHLPAQALAACFHQADMFVCVSDHEGFCVPILESFHYGKPVIAYAAGAVPETVGDAGVILDTRDPVCFAEAIDRVHKDPELALSLTNAGRRRLGSEFAFSRLAGLLRNYLEAVL